jgi:hypothetical protein
METLLEELYRVDCKAGGESCQSIVAFAGGFQTIMSHLLPNYTFDNVPSPIKPEKLTQKGTQPRFSSGRSIFE